MVRPAHVMLTAGVALLGVGVVMVHSAGMSIGATTGLTVGTGGTGTPLDALGLAPRHVAYAGLAVVAMLLGWRIDIAKVLGGEGEGQERWSGAWVVGAVLLLSLGLVALTLVPGMGRSVNGASRWLFIGPRGEGGMGLSFQPSELLKWAMVLAVAWWCAGRGERMRWFVLGLLPALGLIAVACGMVVIEDLGTAVLIAAVAFVLLVAGGARLWQLAMVIPLGVAGVAAAVVHSPYRLARLTAFMDPWADAAGSGYHPIQSMLAFAQGGPWGAGLGNGVQKYYLPEDTTDFIYPILCEELGLGGAALVVVLLLAILWTGLGIVADRRDAFGRLLGLGVLTTVGLQAAVNLAVVTVVVPTKGIALPLISAGGTGWVLTALMLGLVAGLDRGGRTQGGEE